MSGWGLKTQFPSYKETISTGAVMQRYEQEANQEVPIFVKLAFRLGVGASFTLKPHIFSGVVFTFSPEREEELDWQDPPPERYAFKAGGGLDLAFAFPGDKISVFLGAEFNAVTGMTDWDTWVFSPSARGGVTFYPSRGSSSAAPPSLKGSSRGPAGPAEIRGGNNEWTPLLESGVIEKKENTVPVLPVSAVSKEEKTAAAPLLSLTGSPGNQPGQGKGNQRNQLLLALRGETARARRLEGVRPLSDSGAARANSPSFSAGRSFNIDDMLREIKAMQIDVAELKDDLNSLDN